MLTREWLEERQQVVEDLLEEVKRETDLATRVLLIGRARSEVEEVQRALAATLRPSSRKKFALAAAEVLRQARPAARKKAMGFLDGQVGRSGANHGGHGENRNQKAGSSRRNRTYPTDQKGTSRGDSGGEEAGAA